MSSGAFKVALALGAILAFAETQSCGFTPDEQKDEGEPCTRTSECRDDLECRGGVCMVEAIDIDASVPDASAPSDAGNPPVSADAGSDAAP